MRTRTHTRHAATKHLRATKQKQQQNQTEKKNALAITVKQSQNNREKEKQVVNNPKQKKDELKKIHRTSLRNLRRGRRCLQTVQKCAVLRYTPCLCTLDQRQIAWGKHTEKAES